MVSGVPSIKMDIDGKPVKMIVSTETKLSFIGSRMLENRNRVGQDTDYFFGFGEFTTEVFRLPCNISREDVSLHFGRLPDTLADMISMATKPFNIKGILGATIFDEFSRMVFSRREKTLTFKMK